ncbi:regulator of G-protein signaling 2 isoform X1 [Clinocottus analis]|uniref:regulator of G-protein signaling 2 isoform X1 n=1 Tax=Clinocottus analis TaxID=304258 RepID=UPI0035BFEA50
MRENLACVASENMAFTYYTTPADLRTERKEMKSKNWRNRIGFFLKKNTSQSILHPKKNRSYRPTADDVQQWAQSLDKLLSHKHGKTVFRIFLKSEFCEENIEFWTACEDFRNITSHKELASKANSMHEEFIKNEAPKEVTAAIVAFNNKQTEKNKSEFLSLNAINTQDILEMEVRSSSCLFPSQINLDFHTKNAIVQDLLEPTVTSFLAAQRKVYSLMENNSYPRFIDSDLYKELCAAARGEGKHIKS